MKFDGITQKWILDEMQITGSWWQYYPIQNIILNSEIWWKTQFFDKTNLFITYRNKYIVTKYIYSS